MKKGSNRTPRAILTLIAALIVIAAGSAYSTITVDFESATPGASAEGWGAVDPLLNISDWELDYDAVIIEENGAIRSYSAAAGVNGCLIDNRGLGWAVDNHPQNYVADPPDRDYWEFDLSNDKIVTGFSAVLLDYGDFYSQAGNGVATMIAYDYADNPVATDEFVAGPTANSAYDACASEGAQTLSVEYLNGIDHVRVYFDGIDDGIGFDNIALTIDDTPSGAILSPTDGSEVHAGDLLDLIAEYYDDNPGSAVFWAVRVDENTSCSNVGDNQYWGNVDGDHDPFTWTAISDGMRFESTADTSGWPLGEYCFVFNPGAGDTVPKTEYNVRLISHFSLVDQAPVADPGGPYVLPLDATFDGSGSYDPDGDPITYSWDFGDGTTGTGVMPTHTYASAGYYDVCLTVNDGYLDSPQVCTTAAIYDGYVNGGGQIIQIVEEGVKKPEAYKVSFGGWLYRIDGGNPLCEWEVNLHNVSIGDLDKSTFHGNVCTKPGHFNPGGSDGVTNFAVYGTLNGMPGYTLVMRVEDNTEPGNLDTIRFELFFDPDMKVTPGNSLSTLALYDTSDKMPAGHVGGDFASVSTNNGNARTGLDNGNLQIYLP